MFNMRATISEPANKLVTKKKIQHYTYSPEDILGKGFSSQVYRGRDDHTGEPVAVKVVEMDMIKNDLYKDLLASQIYCLKLLRNAPNIIQLKDVYSTKNNTYVICQLCELGTLSSLLLKKKLSENEALRFMEQLVKGYLHLHKLGIIHRDIKPANIFVQKDKLKIADFGFATFCSEKKIQQKYNIGSPLYMPPESLMKNQYSFKSDIWSLGIVFYEMLFGKAPWRAHTESELLNKILQTSIVHLIPKGSLSSISMDLLKRILDPDSRTRMSPEELAQFSFNKPKQVVSSIISKPKTATKQQQGLVSTNGTVNSTSSSELLSMTKQLLSQMHMCRFIFKLIIRIHQSKVQNKDSQMLIMSLKQFLGYKLSQMSQLQYSNPLNIPYISEYRRTQDYSKLMTLVKTYRTKYQTELGRLQENTPNLMSNILGCLSQLIRYLSSGFSKVTSQTVKYYQSNILLLDYLTTAYMLIKLASKNDIVLFAQKSKIQDIVDGNTTSVGYQHFIAIQNKISALGLI